MNGKFIAVLCLIVLLLGTLFNTCSAIGDFNQATTETKKADSEEVEKVSEKLNYMIYYSVLNDSIIETAKKYDVVILHPKMGNISREQIQEIRSSGTIVLGYIAVGEDLRTYGMTAEQMLEDERFTADRTGPRVDPRKQKDKEFDNDDNPNNDYDYNLEDIDLAGKASPGGTGYASYYLDDNDLDGKPDVNPNFKCAYTNIGDPAWFDVLNEMTMDGIDQVPGIKEILTDSYGRSLGCDGLFLDTIDTCAPNYYTDDDNPGKTRFEWTAPGVNDFIAKIKEKYPDKLICQNRGLFFYNPQLPHYKFTTRKNIDYLMFESYMLDSNPAALYNENYFADNKFNYAPKLIAEAGRPDGFKILSLGYAEGPDEYELQDTLMGKSTAGLDILMNDLNEAKNEAGFSHYITNGEITLVNNFALTHGTKDELPPKWSSVYNDCKELPIQGVKARVGIAKTTPIANAIVVSWDVAIDKNDVIYTLYYQKEPFDFESDPDLKNAQSIVLSPEIGEGYADSFGADVFPYQAVINGLDADETYYFVIRAKDDSPNHNEEKNTVVKTGVPIKE